MEILNPKALQLIKDMQDLKLIKVSEEPYSKLSTYLKKMSRDPNDDFLLSLSKDSNADFLLTSDKDLLELKKFGKTKIISLSEFLVWTKK